MAAAFTTGGHMSPFVPTAALAIALGASAAFATEPILKSTMPDGRIIYGESPMPGAKRVDKVATPPEHAGIATVTADERKRADAILPPERGGVAVIPQPVRPPVQPATQGYSANPDNRLTNRRY
jgi:hypothetical protein